MQKKTVVKTRDSYLIDRYLELFKKHKLIRGLGHESETVTCDCGLFKFMNYNSSLKKILGLSTLKSGCVLS